jgi:hypothetical protein
MKAVNYLSVSFAVYMKTLALNQIRASNIRIISVYQTGSDVKWSDHGLILEILGICLQGVRSTTTTQWGQAVLPAQIQKQPLPNVTGNFGFRSVIYVDTKPKIVIRWLDAIHSPCNVMIVQCLIKQTAQHKLNNHLSLLPHIHVSTCTRLSSGKCVQKFTGRENSTKDVCVCADLKCDII